AERSMPLPDTAIQVAFASPGLQVLGLPAEVIRTFSPEFVSGMSGDDNRSRRLGDLAANAPSSWQWGGPGDQPHLLVMLYAREGKLEGWKQTVVRNLSESGLTVQRCLSTAVVDGYEPFGFKDGLSQPELDWNQKREVGDSNQLAYGNIVALGEFLLGYANEYGQYTASPTVDAASDRQSALLPATDQPSKRDLGRNGTYLVLRDL